MSHGRENKKEFKLRIFKGSGLASYVGFAHPLVIHHWASLAYRALKLNVLRGRRILSGIGVTTRDTAGVKLLALSGTAG